MSPSSTPSKGQLPQIEVPHLRRRSSPTSRKMDSELERRFFQLKAKSRGLDFSAKESKAGNEANTSTCKKTNSRTLPLQKKSEESKVGRRISDNNGKKTKSKLKLTWADHKSGFLSSSCPFEGDLPAASIRSSRLPSSPSPSKEGRSRIHWRKKEPSQELPHKLSYKDALLKTPSHPASSPSSTKHKSTFRPPPLSSVRKRRCFRCLATDHQIGECREPFRCSRCYKFGHPTCNYRVRRSRELSNMQRALRFRPLSLKAFVPFSKGYHSRQQQCRNAILANVIGTTNLGHFPQDMIASDFANQFGGFSNDFHVARYRETDYVICLPQWVHSGDLVRRRIIYLSHYKLRCFSWNPYKNAFRSRLKYKAWIKLVNLPFECWSESSVSSIVNGFGRYLKVDNNSLNVLDLICFRCQVAVRTRSTFLRTSLSPWVIL